MIPLGDVSRRPVRIPVITGGIIALNAIVFAMELMNGESFVQHWALVPADIAAGQRWNTILTAMFLHGGWEHIIGNMVFLWAFGPEIEDVMGRTRYLIFYLLGGLVATVAQVAASPSSTVPNLGASGAIAAVMGAFLVTFPRDKIRAIVFLGWYVTITVIPSMLLVGLWFIVQLFSEVGAVANVQTGGVAYLAHIGGFMMGMATARLFEVRERVEAAREPSPF
jgi:membrane associated rhomboid family serine protease